MPLGLVIFWHGATGLGAAWDLHFNGIERPAIVTGKDISRSHSTHGFFGRRERETPYVSYRVDLNGTRVDGRHKVSRALYDRLATGDRVTARVAPSPPHLSEIERGRAVTFVIGSIPAGLALAGVGLLMFLRRRHG